MTMQIFTQNKLLNKLTKGKMKTIMQAATAAVLASIYALINMSTSRSALIKTEVTLVASCIIFGWYAGALLQIFNGRQSTADAKGRVVEAFTAASMSGGLTLGSEEFNNAELESEVEDCGQITDEFCHEQKPLRPLPPSLSTGLALLESYDAFGAVPGAWNGQVSSNHRFRHCLPGSGLSMLENYGAFGASPGSWSGKVISCL
eukprot:gnl/TRDRNA2_/TRDRNA2_191897_c0_seq1.p1 gnl/TRDRNA2_/TRDRNA2_191897_c0~~gnl/TRDRNA2_/TRDRNA2_191897_c0_seq1.p1  ORF type:complete len:203 (+),score=53.03 gnl/TRDRNA2_/TRDRNA2_191897_c0_seq1:124-732(+)